MRARPTAAVLLLLLCAACGTPTSGSGPAPAPASASAPASAPASPSSWRAIRFVDVTDPFGPHTVLRSDITSSSSGIRVSLYSHGTTEDVLHDAVIRLHVASAAPTTGTTDPVLDDLRWGRPDDGPRVDFRASAAFPWQGAPLDEAFVEVDLGARGRYWLEVPYGFVAAPVAHEGQSDAREEPVRAPAMASLGERDHWVPFRDVTYDLGVIQNGWRLTARLANPFDAHAELELYRDDSHVGQSMFLWQLDEPRTHVEIVEATGATLHAMPMQVRLHDDGMRRSDDFHFNRGGPGHRAVGTFRATVGERTVEVPIPSSLYGYTHGTADPYDTHRVAGAEQVLGEGMF